MKRRPLVITLAIVGVAVGVFVTAVAPIVDRRMNTVIPGPGVPVSTEAAALHTSATVVDLHADALLWPRDLNDRHANGHVDLPRL
ncbi:MAG: peptidase M19, partial [Gemmatimonadetes bacterium]|nr:peptidase M19 [Gemmatimonadota bacterium]